MRLLFEHERPLIEHLFKLAAVALPDSLLVQPMADGGMGSLAIAPIGNGRRFGSVAAEYQFRDVDGTLVSAALMLDQQGAPFEVDIWKVDFSPLKRWPIREDLA